MKVSIIVPTYNERDNLEELFSRISSALKGYDYEIIIVDDDSPDKPGRKRWNSRSSIPLKL